jgi:hypothetical protein
MMPRKARSGGLLSLVLAAAVLVPLAARAQSFDNLDDPPGDTEREAPAAPRPDEPRPADLDSAAAQPAPSRALASPDYALRLRELEDRVNELKEEIFRSKSRLVLLRERVLQTNLGGSQALITHVNDMSATFDLEQLIYSLDGAQLYSAVDDDGSLAGQARIEIYNGAIVPGPHNISVEMSFVGNGFGLFSYLEGYRFRLRSSYAFTAEDGKLARVDVIAYERGGVNQPIEDRPDIRYEVEFLDASTDDTVARER